MASWESKIFGSIPLSIAKGEVNFHEVVFLSGKNPDVSTAVLPATIWNVGGRYPWSAWNGGNKTLYLASDNAGDNKTVILNGLDENYNIVTKSVTLNGLTPVNTGVASFYRLNNALYFDGDTGNLGTITIRIGSDTGTIVGKIDPGIANTSMSIYTVPAGYTAYSVYGDFSVNKGEGAQLNAMWRFFGASFICVYATEVYEQHITADPMVPGAIPEKSDIDNVARFVTTNGTRVYSNQQLILVKNNALHV